MPSTPINPLLRSCLAAALLAAASSCTGTHRPDSGTAANAASPSDFWLSVTVLQAPAETASRAAAYLRAPLATRPARYVVEADRMLHAAVGSGASDDFFPPETRQLSEPEFNSLWQLVNTPSLAAASPGTPAEVGAAPTRADAARLASGRTLYAISYSARGDRRTLAIDVDPAAPDNPRPTADARALVERLAALAWMK